MSQSFKITFPAYFTELAGWDPKVFGHYIIPVRGASTCSSVCETIFKHLQPIISKLKGNNLLQASDLKIYNLEWEEQKDGDRIVEVKSNSGNRDL